MLQLAVKNSDLRRITKLFAINHIVGEIESDKILIEHEISENILGNILDCAEVSAASNYESEQNLNVENEDVSKSVSPSKHILYNTVMRGEVYLCDLGEPTGFEQAFTRYCIVVKHNDDNLYSPTTIVAPCTTSAIKELNSSRIKFHFSEENMDDFSTAHVSNKENILLVDHLRVISKDKLLKYLGRMNRTFMDQFVNPLIQNTLEINTNTPKVFSPTQIELLKDIDTEKIINIMDTDQSDMEKITKILEVFGFNMKKNGMNYLCEGILISLNASKNLKELSEIISKNKSISASEIERLIIARVKDKYGKKIQTIQFIRLISRLIELKGALS